MIEFLVNYYLRNKTFLSLFRSIYLNKFEVDFGTNADFRRITFICLCNNSNKIKYHLPQQENIWILPQGDAVRWDCVEFFIQGFQFLHRRAVIVSSDRALRWGQQPALVVQSLFQHSHHLQTDMSLRARMGNMANG